MTDAKLASIYRQKHPEEVSLIAQYPSADPNVFLIPILATTTETEWDKLVFIGYVLKRFSPFTLLEGLKMEPGVRRELEKTLKLHRNTITNMSCTANVYYKGNAKFRNCVDNYRRDL